MTSKYFYNKTNQEKNDVENAKQIAPKILGMVKRKRKTPSHPVYDPVG